MKKQELRRTLFGGFRVRDVERILAEYEVLAEELKQAEFKAKEEQAELEDTVTTMAGQLSDIQQSLNKYLSSTSWLKAQVARFKGDNTRLKAQIHEKDELIKSLEKEKIQLDFKVNMLKSKISKLTVEGPKAPENDEMPPKAASAE